MRFYTLILLLLVVDEVISVAQPFRNCTFQADIDYHGITGHVIGSSNQTHCCKACTNDPRCHVAVLSATTDDPPSECWLKFGALAQVPKKGVTACIPAGR